MTKQSLNKGFYVSANRKSKAQKIIAVLQEELENDNLKNSVVLDVGTGNGYIAHFLSNTVKQLVSVDISDSRTIKNNYNFLTCNEALPFKKEQFDIVISNHVIEHVENNKLHLSEINRVLKSNGVVYLATPNRLWPWEVHYRLFFLHYLPQKKFMKLIKWFNLYHEELNLLFWHKLKFLIRKNFKYTVYCDQIAHEPNKYHLKVSKKISLLLKWIPLKLYTLLTFLNPTFIITLRKKIK